MADVTYQKSKETLRTLCLEDSRSWRVGFNDRRDNTMVASLVFGNFFSVPWVIAVELN